MTVLAYSPVLPSVELFGAYEGIASATAINETVSLTFTPTEGTLFVVPYEIDTISQLQLEVGPTPSSYIPTPTSGATVTRAAETLTVPAANLPWPSPVVIGDELVTNGTFDTDSDWTKYGTTEISGGVASATSATSIVSQDGALTAERVYVLTLDYTETASSRLRVENIAGGILGISEPIISTGSGSVSIAFVAKSTGFKVAADGALFTGTIDNISVREINPLSVSIQMDGRMTYADTDNAEEVLFLRWAKTLDNTEIELQLRTTAGRTGEPSFLQRNLGVADNVFGPTTTTYSPGTLVPFNIASRHGSTFINGAVDGVALTADTTPVALPDLSATDLSLGYAFMGTIRTFRIWADDLGDTGIEEAST